jgi:hypothetical protein
VRRNLVRIAGILLRLGLTIGLLTLKASLVMLAAVQIACLAFDFSVTLFLIRRQYPEVRISLADFDFGMVRRIFFLQRVCAVADRGRTSELRDRRPGDWRADGRRLDPVLCGRQQSHRLCDGLRHSHRRGRLPMATKLATEGKSDELREMFLKWSKVALSLTLMVGLFLIVFGPTFIGWWIDPSYRTSLRPGAPDPDGLELRLSADQRCRVAAADGPWEAENAGHRVARRGAR